MTSILRQLAPSVTNMIRLDHTQVLATFHQYESSASPRLRKGIADNVCLALEIHAELEEEIFYPVLRLVLDDERIRKSPLEHDEMRTLVARLRQMVPADPMFDETFFELMRMVMHHVADEETRLLPAAERLMPQQLADLGAQMARRRVELTAARGGELAGTLVRSLSTGTVLAAATTALAGAHLLARHGSDIARPWMPLRRSGTTTTPF